MQTKEGAYGGHFSPRDSSPFPPQGSMFSIRLAFFTFQGVTGV